MFTVTTRFASIESIGGTLARNLRNVEKPLARAGGLIRSAAEDLILSGTLPPLAESTLKRKLTVAQYKVGASSGRRGGYAPAVLKFNRILNRSKEFGGNLAGIDDKQIQKIAERHFVRALAAQSELQRQLAEVSEAHARVKTHDDLINFAEAEMARRAIHGAGLRAAKSLPLQPGERKVTRQFKNKKTGKMQSVTVIENPSKERRHLLRMGAKRYRNDIRSTIPLGGFINAGKIFVTRGKVVVFFAGPAAKANNEGATVGNGAKLPERRFLQITAPMVTEIVGIFEEEMVAGL